VTNDIRREAERLLAQLRADHVPPSLGYRFPDTPGLPMPLEDWIAKTDPGNEEGPRRTR